MHEPSARELMAVSNRPTNERRGEVRSGVERSK